MASGMRAPRIKHPKLLLEEAERSKSRSPTDAIASDNVARVPTRHLTRNEGCLQGYRMPPPPPPFPFPLPLPTGIPPMGLRSIPSPEAGLPSEVQVEETLQPLREEKRTARSTGSNNDQGIPRGTVSPLLEGCMRSSWIHRDLLALLDKKS